MRLVVFVAALAAGADGLLIEIHPEPVDGDPQDPGEDQGDVARHVFGLRDPGCLAFADH